MSWTDDVLHTLTGAMSLLRRCRVNAALTIQLFSQLFHFINMWLFNRLVTDPDSGLCSHYWGAIIRQQLGHIEAWAEKQGLELAADCHLSRIVQVCTRLYSILCASPSSLLMYWWWISDFIMDKNLGSVNKASVFLSSRRFRQDLGCCNKAAKTKCHSRHLLPPTSGS